MADMAMDPGKGSFQGPDNNLQFASIRLGINLYLQLAILFRLWSMEGSGEAHSQKLCTNNPEPC